MGALQYRLSNLFEVTLSFVCSGEDERNITNRHSCLNVLAARYRCIFKVCTNVLQSFLFVGVVPAGFQLYSEVFTRGGKTVNGQSKNLFR